MCNGSAIHNASLYDSSLEPPPAAPSQVQSKASSTCFKVFALAIVIISIIAIVVGTLALLACKDIFPPYLELLTQLTVIGEVNSGMIVAGGVTLFVLGIFALYKKENQSSCSRSVHTLSSSSQV